MGTPLQLLIVEDSENDALLLLRELRKCGYEPVFERVDTAEAMEASLAAQEWEIVVSDFVMPCFSGLAALELLKKSGLDIPFIVVSGKTGEETAVEVMKAGAHDYIIKENLSRLAPAIRRELAEAAVRRNSRQVTEALRESEEKMRIIAETAADAVISIDCDGAISYWNPAAERILGYTSQEAMGRELHPLLAPEQYLDAYRKGFAIFRDSGTGMAIGKSIEFIALKKDGSEIPVEVSFSAMNMKGKWGAIGILRDISERKNLEKQLRQAQKMEAIGTLASGIAHDFNNILTAIIGFSTLIKMHMRRDDPQRENLNNVLAAASRAADLTGRLLTFSRKQAINLQLININQSISNLGKFLQRIIGEDIEFKTSFSQDSLYVNADTGQIEQVLMNLAANARDAMPKGGILSIETEPVMICKDFIKVHGYGKPGEYALISITDTGMGMDGATRAKVFDPFFTTKEIGKGTGLGLSIVYGIIKQHNGFINVYSEQNVGTTFTIYLPRIRNVAGRRPDDRDETLENGTETILVADDDPSLRELSRQVLGQFGYTVITAENGQDAIDRFGENRDKIDLVILDIIMPGISGKEAFEEMRKIRPGIKAIFISGYTADIVHKRGMLDMNLKFLRKPMRPLNLLKKVREVLDMTS